MILIRAAVNGIPSQLFNIIDDNETIEKQFFDEF
jgi:hypothetical protein